MIDMTNNVKRFQIIDFLRGIAVILMIIFHFSYDLDLFGYVDINFLKDPFWWFFPRVIVFLFLISVGASLSLAHSKKIQWPNFNKRLLKLVACAIVITVSTYFMFPKNWIYFGTLHCIAGVSLLILPFINRPKISFVFFLVFMVPAMLGYKWPFWNMPHASMDYIPLLPWVGIGFLGISYKHFLMEKTDQWLASASFPGKEMTLKMGRHSLLIYLVHQPLLFGIVWTMTKLVNLS